MATWLYRSMARTFVATLLFTVSLVSTNAAAPEGVPDVPQYNAPQKMTPRARLGGSLRGSEGEDPAVAALVPDHVGITVDRGFAGAPATWIAPAYAGGRRTAELISRAAGDL